MFTVTVETDTTTTEYQGVTKYAGYGLRGRWLVLWFKDGSFKQIRASIVREIDVSVEL